MSIGLLGWGRFMVTDENGEVTRITIPSPVTDKTKPWLVDMVSATASDLGAYFTHFQFPPMSKCQGGSGKYVDGYGVFDRYDLGSKDQQGSITTQYGTKDGFLQAIALLNANGVAPVGDLVPHQSSGENGGPGVFKFKGADGKTLNGRGGPTDPSHFWSKTLPTPPWRKMDTVPGGPGDMDFGRAFSYQYSPEARANCLAWLTWMVLTTGIRMWRLDDVKGMYTPFVKEMVDLLISLNCEVYGEYSDGNSYNLGNWALGPIMRGTCGVSDFPAKYRIQEACNNYDAYAFDRGGAGFFETAPDLSYGFLDSPDSDTSPGQQVISNKLLGYAYGLTLPMHLFWVAGKDYYPASLWPGAYGLYKTINKIVWAARMFAIGKYRKEYQDDKVFISSRDGDGGKFGWSGGLLTAINFDTNRQRIIYNVRTPFGPNTHLQDYVGHGDDLWTDAYGYIPRLVIPQNTNSSGQSFCMYSKAGVSTPLPKEVFQTRQVLFGSFDLDHDGLDSSKIEDFVYQTKPDSIFRSTLTVGSYVYKYTGKAKNSIILHTNPKKYAGGLLSKIKKIVGMPTKYPFTLDVTYTGRKGD